MYPTESHSPRWTTEVETTCHCVDPGWDSTDRSRYQAHISSLIFESRNGYDGFDVYRGWDVLLVRSWLRKVRHSAPKKWDWPQSSENCPMPSPFNRGCTSSTGKFWICYKRFVFGNCNADNPSNMNAMGHPLSFPLIWQSGCQRPRRASRRRRQLPRPRQTNPHPCQVHEQMNRGHP